MWNSIVSESSAINSLGIPFDRSFEIRIGNGEKTHFWLDVWHVSGLCLKDMYPRLFALERFKSSFFQQVGC